MLKRKEDPSKHRQESSALGVEVTGEAQHTEGRRATSNRSRLVFQLRKNIGLLDRMSSRLTVILSIGKKI